MRSQVDRANRALAAVPNAQAAVGDFQDLQLPEHVYDAVFVIESLCHATDLPRAFTEIKRVLAPGGRLIVIDAWRTDRYAASSDAVKEADDAASSGRWPSPTSRRSRPGRSWPPRTACA